MGHLTHIKQEYRVLSDRLNADIVGLPEPNAKNTEARKGWLDILKLFFTTEEAKIAALLPITPSSLSSISSITGEPENILASRLNTLADKGVVLDLINPETGTVMYSLAPPVVGFFELTMMKTGGEIVSKQKFAEAVGAYCSNNTDFAKEVHGFGKTALGRSLVYESLISEGLIPSVYDWDRIIELLKQSNKIAISNCYCRHKAEHLAQACNAPVETCFSLNSFGEYVIRRKFGRQIDTSEAIDILEHCRESGLVHLVDNVKQEPAWICNCCNCCCGVLRAINALDFPAVNPSRFIPERSVSSCSGCQKCLKKCPVGAIQLSDKNVAKTNLASTDKTHSDKTKSVSIDTTRCIGCGICAFFCPENAIEMGVKKTEPFIPDTALELKLLRAFERGKLNNLIQSNGFLANKNMLALLISVILSMNKQDQELALKQLNSSYIIGYINREKLI